MLGNALLALVSAAALVALGAGRRAAGQSLAAETTDAATDSPSP
jgi:hypothetical protein